VDKASKLSSKLAERTVGAVLEAAATSRPFDKAVIFEGRTLTNDELFADAKRAQRLLSAAGLRQGDRLLIMLENSIDYLSIWLGASLAGIIEVPINTGHVGQMLKYTMSDSGARVIVTESTFLDRIFDAAGVDSQLQDVLVIGEQLPGGTPPVGLRLRLFADVDLTPQSGNATDDEVTVRERDPIGVLYTSGTTGPAKGTLVSHRHAVEYAAGCAELLQLSPGDVYYAPLPLFHIAGQWAVVLAALTSGATTVITRRFSVVEFWNDCDRHNVTTTFLLGAMAQFLIGQPSEARDAQHSLDRILMVPLVEGLEEFRSRFDVRVTTAYGSTETGAPLGANFDVVETSATGTPRPGYQLRLVDDDDEEVSAGQVGELCIRHEEPWVTMIEYLGKPEATAQAFRNQWLHTGDSMRVDNAGIYYFVDRLGDTLRRRGENISSFEVEREVYAHPAVLECAAIGVPSPHTEEDLLVVVVARPEHELSAADLREFLAERVPRFMVPDRVIVLDALPKTPTGKIQKSALREMAARNELDVSGEQC
jgi:carnitine-CoA ligase